jgi:hypothetical protein
MIRARIVFSTLTSLLALTIFATVSQGASVQETGKELGYQCAKEHPKDESSQSECVKEKCQSAYTENRQRLMCQAKALEALMAIAVPDPQKRKVFEDLIRLPKDKTIGRACLSQFPDDFTSQKHCIEQTCSKWFSGQENRECQYSCLKVITKTALPPPKPNTANSDVNSTETIPEGSIKSRCLKISSGNYLTQGNCINQQIEAANQVKTFMETHPEGTKERSIMLSCASMWKDGDTYDFVTVMECTNRQLKAYDRLHQ